MKRACSTAMVLLAVAALLSDSVQPLFAQPPGRSYWTAQWIAHPTAPLREAAIFHFRKSVSLTTRPEKFIVEVSADNRFLLFVNGVRIGEGPARGDMTHWRYETFDLAPAMREGKNIIAATVWNFGIYAPLAQISNRTAFLMQGDSERESVADTNATWQVEEEPGLAFVPRVPDGLWLYWAADPPEKLVAKSYDWGWMDDLPSSNSHWVAAATAIRESIYPGAGTPVAPGKNPGPPWRVIPNALPQMEFKSEPAGKVVRADLSGATEFPESPVMVPAHRKIEVLLDHGVMTSGYPELTVSGGNGSHIRIGYTEALYDAKNRRNDRNKVGNLRVLGLFDSFDPDGGASRIFRPLWFRTWRYLELEIETGDEPLLLEKLSTYFSAYPFKERGSFDSNDAQLGKIWEICWRTARLGAHETYMDTPYWEQLQYIDDTRIQALISYTVAGDDRLARQALHAFDDSRVPEGITQSRYPSLLPQFIPNFSLSYLNMLHDYWMYRGDPAFIQELLPGTRPVLAWFLARQREDGFLGSLPYWLAVDSQPGLQDFPRLDHEGRSALITLLFADALKDAAEMETAMGDADMARRYRDAALHATAAVYRSCWNTKLGLLADTPDQNSYSEHTNVLGVLTDAIPHDEQAPVLRRLPSLHAGDAFDIAGMTRVSDHYQFYLSRAMDKAGLGAEYLRVLGPWRGMLARGLTTTPEYEDPTRSDTHAWSAHPIYDLLTIVAGIHPAAPGFARVRIAPNPGTLERFAASMPHPAGDIQVTFDRHGETADIAVELPGDLSGSLIWNGKEHPLKGGKQSFQLAVQ